MLESHRKYPYASPKFHKYYSGLSNIPYGTLGKLRPTELFDIHLANQPLHLATPSCFIDTEYPDEKIRYIEYYREHVLGSEPLSENTIVKLEPTKGNVEIGFDAYTETERVAQYALDGPDLISAGYPDPLLFYSARLSDRVQGFKRWNQPLYKQTPFSINMFDSGDLRSIPELLQAESIKIQKQLISMSAHWAKIEDAALPLIAQTVGINQDDFIRRPKRILGTNIPIGSYYKRENLPEFVRKLYDYTNTTYPEHVAVPLAIKRNGVPKPKFLNYIIIEELMHNEIESLILQYNLDHNQKEAIMSAALHRVLYDLVGLAYNQWMSGDNSRTSSLSTFSHLDHLTEPILEGKSTIRHALNKLDNPYARLGLSNP